jgi:hypothetical protein
MNLTEIYQETQESPRLDKYQTFDDLLTGDHFKAFSIKSDEFKEAYARLRYIVCNFSGLISKVIADMLFGEEITLVDHDNQGWVDTLAFENNLDTLFFEHAVRNSALGDNLFKILVRDKKIVLEDVSPALYFPELDTDDVRREPLRQYLAWQKTVNGINYLLVEEHEPPFVRTRVGEIVKGETVKEIDLETFNSLTGQNYQEEVDTGTERPLLIHVPNWRDGGFWGLSDYVDMEPLLFALNNRMSKIDNILDKHSDPILAVPEGVLDEEGRITKEALNLFELGPESQSPEYIVWNANLEAAFKQVDKLVEFLFMFSETSPDVLGMGQGGQAESGRALKMRLIRTIAKRSRKKLYYDRAIKNLVYTAELLAKINGYKISDDIKVNLGEPQLPEIKWQDGIVNDEVERTDIVLRKVDGGLLDRRSGLIELDGVSEDEADEILKQVDKEKADFTSIFDNKEQNDEEK